MVALHTRPPELPLGNDGSVSVQHEYSHHGRLGLASSSSLRLGRTTPLLANNCRRNDTVHNNRSLTLIKCIKATPTTMKLISGTMELSARATIARLPDAIQSFSTGCLNMGERDSKDDGRTTAEIEVAEVDRGVDAHPIMPGEDDENPKQVDFSLCAEEDLSLFISENELRIIKNERLRRRKISEANKKTFSLNNVKNHKQESDKELLSKEKQRRQRLSAALAGRIAWNKGKEISEETRQRIRERTIEAMKNPKVRAKLRGATKQSNETKSKIKASMVRIWEQRRKVKLVQESCVKEWKECIADIARRGFGSDTAYSWNSYDTIKKELQHAWKVQNQARSSKEASACRKKRSNTKLKLKDATKTLFCSNGENKDSRQAKVREAYKTGEAMHKNSETAVKACDCFGNDRNSKPLRDSSTIMGPWKQQKVYKSSYAYKNPSSIEKLERLKEIRARRRLKQSSERVVLKDSDQRIALERAGILLGRAQMVTLDLKARARTNAEALHSMHDAHQLLAEAERLLKTVHMDENCINFHDQKPKC